VILCFPVTIMGYYVGLRAKEDTQLEHQLIARQIAMILGIELPTIVKAVVQTEDHSLDGWRFLSDVS